MQSLENVFTPKTYNHAVTYNHASANGNLPRKSLSAGWLKIFQKTVYVVNRWELLVNTVYAVYPVYAIPKAINASINIQIYISQKLFLTRP